MFSAPCVEVTVMAATIELVPDPRRAQRAQSAVTRNCICLLRHALVKRADCLLPDICQCCISISPQRLPLKHATPSNPQTREASTKEHDRVQGKKKFRQGRD